MTDREGTARARACSNIAFIKYWGNADEALRLPVNPSLSMNLDALYTDTTVRWDASLTSDSLMINGAETDPAQRDRVSAHLDAVRKLGDFPTRARVESVNNFPTGTGIASSASAFAALSLAATEAAGLHLSERELTTLARLGSGSASRSIPAGFVEWKTGSVHEGSYSESIAPVDYWALADVIVIVSDAHKAVGSRAGHTSAGTSDLQNARVAGAVERLETCKAAILSRDFATLAEVVERDSNLMHAVMMTSRPPLFYWLPPTLAIMERVRQLRWDEGLSVCYTLDAGPNVHCICLELDADAVEQAMRQMPGVLEVRVGRPGPAAHIVSG
jgi:diphosphomevalonate decarboxylase